MLTTTPTSASPRPHPPNPSTHSLASVMSRSQRVGAHSSGAAVQTGSTSSSTTILPHLQQLLKLRVDLVHLQITHPSPVTGDTCLRRFPVHHHIYLGDTHARGVVPVKCSSPTSQPHFLISSLDLRVFQDGVDIIRLNIDAINPLSVVLLPLAFSQDVDVLSGRGRSLLVFVVLEDASVV